MKKTVVFVYFIIFLITTFIVTIKYPLYLVKINDIVRIEYQVYTLDSDDSGFGKYITYDVPISEGVDILKAIKLQSYRYLGVSLNVQTIEDKIVFYYSNGNEITISEKMSSHSIYGDKIQYTDIYIPDRVTKLIDALIEDQNIE